MNTEVIVNKTREKENAVQWLKARLRFSETETETETGFFAWRPRVTMMESGQTFWEEYVKRKLDPFSSGMLKSPKFSI